MASVLICHQFSPHAPWALKRRITTLNTQARQSAPPDRLPCHMKPLVNFILAPGSSVQPPHALHWQIQGGGGGFGTLSLRCACDHCPPPSVMPSHWQWSWRTWWWSTARFFWERSYGLCWDNTPSRSVMRALFKGGGCATLIGLIMGLISSNNCAVQNICLESQLNLFFWHWLSPHSSVQNFIAGPGSRFSPFKHTKV